MEIAIFIAVVVWMCIEGYYFFTGIREEQRLKVLLYEEKITFEEYKDQLEKFALNQKLPHFFDNGIPKN